MACLRTPWFRNVNIQSILSLMGPIFATRMLLMVRKSHDTRTRSVISTLIFNPVNMESDCDTPGSAPDTVTGTRSTENIGEHAISSIFRRRARSEDTETEHLGRAV
jgi:hypothetical protein